MVDGFTLFRPLIHMLPPETAHNVGLTLLRSGLWPAVKPVRYPSLKMQVFGLHFSNPVGLAAGFDKNAVAVDALLNQGFGFVEAGTVTPKPQPGNPKPRLFRLREDEAVINRLGFNNEGLAAYLGHFRRRQAKNGIAGANIGKNKDSEDAIADYVTGLEAVYPYADYVTINISSPNTEGLRALQQKEALNQLLSALKTTRRACLQKHERRVPMLLKVAPDLTQKDREDIMEVVLAQEIDGLIAGNTTLARPDSLRSCYRTEQGGLSGRPLLKLATDNLKEFYRLSAGRIPLIGVGGVASAEDAYSKIRAGASLLQLYTAIVYQGFGIAPRICKGLAALLERDGFSSLQQAVGADMR